VTSPVDHALRRIDKVLASGFEPETAYPLRARLGRATLSASRAATNLAEPAQALSLLDRLEAATKHIMQPSEPFDAHWREQWADVLDDLRTLRTLLQPLSDARSDGV
jgi:hypothetical protein